MNFAELLNRITGFSCPVFGVQWNPPESERAIAKRVITYLEDRRVLYSPAQLEMPDHCVHSVIDIREHLTAELQKLGAHSGLADALRAMRTACRKFLNTVQADDRRMIHFAERGSYDAWVFNGALGELRGVFGVHVLQIAVSHGLDVEDDLASILPAEEQSAPEMIDQHPKRDRADKP
jgi:hypothetical protein